MRSKIRWALAALVLALALASLLAPSALAAPRTPRTPRRPQASVSCSLSVSANPLYVTQPYSGSETVTWSCSGAIWDSVGLNINWGDGSLGAYSCWFNCIHGQHAFSHTYSKTGTFSAAVSVNEVDYVGFAYFQVKVFPPCIGPPTFC